MHYIFFHLLAMHARVSAIIVYDNVYSVSRELHEPQKGSDRKGVFAFSKILIIMQVNVFLNGCIEPVSEVNLNHFAFINYCAPHCNSVSINIRFPIYKVVASLSKRKLTKQCCLVLKFNDSSLFIVIEISLHKPVWKEKPL